MIYENYYEKLTPMQKAKWEEKKGPLIYRDWYDLLSKNLDIETSGAILLAVLHYDITGGTKPIPTKYMKIIKKNPTAMVLLDTFIPATAAATRQWINRHKLINTDAVAEYEKKQASQTEVAEQSVGNPLDDEELF